MTGVAERLRPTIRMRLTLLYTGLFLCAGVVLLGLTYILVQNNLQRQSEPVSGEKVLDVSRAPGTPDAGTPDAGTPDAGASWVSSQRFEGALLKARRESRHETLGALLTQGGIALGLVAAAGLGFGWLLADRALRPVHKITETAGRVARSHDLTERIAYEGPRDDVKELADAFDTMLGRLARAFDGQRRFVANASHELRTPLAINRTLVDVAVRRPDATDDVKRLGESLLVVNGRHERLIDGLLTLAGTENVVADAGPLDLSDVASHVLDQAGPEAGARGVTAGHRLAPAVTSGDPVLVERLVQNLVENAIRHNHDGGDLSVTTGESGGWAELRVTNTGPVVPAYEAETIFEPFRRLGTDRAHSDRGSGLGLSIVRATATAHGGTVTAVPRPGGGLAVTVRLPASPDAAADETASGPNPRAATPMTVSTERNEGARPG
ncbi:sensor histidine kinase [Actinomadura livida]|uniref:histidine kinase n=1 Tax=Actinomadura livida TaxID=79909 RepID=A0A7W7IDE4_9ACTN|nr:MULTISPECIES: HAMP domain-containing sensor histidine kinase [Actinomadura]MBB4775005.1 signal transduction histidine kinase [Actinomadura catellatispora]GGT87152.1 sensor protein CutS [Actinomadura livida]